MRKNADAWWCHRCAIEIKVSIELRICRQFRVDAGGATKHVESSFGLRDKLIPEMEGEVLVNTG